VRLKALKALKARTSPLAHLEKQKAARKPNSPSVTLRNDPQLSKRDFASA
jgi:hypothetical protein